MSSFADAVVACRYQPYDTIAVTVNLPWILMPFVRLQPHHYAIFAEPFEQAALDLFSCAASRRNSESMKIIDSARYGWRLLTEAELHRLDELHLELEFALAALQRTRASSN